MDQGGDTYQEKSKTSRWTETRGLTNQLSHIYDILFATKLSSERRLDRPFRRRLQWKPKN